MSEKLKPSELEKEYPPLPFEEFARVQNNFFLMFLDEPLNYHRYQIPLNDLIDAMNRERRGESLSFPQHPLLIKLSEKNPELAQKLAEAITEGDKRKGREKTISENSRLLYEAYLIMRKHLEPGKNEGEAFGFYIFYPPKNK